MPCRSGIGLGNEGQPEAKASRRGKPANAHRGQKCGELCARASDEKTRRAHGSSRATMEPASTRGEGNGTDDDITNMATHPGLGFSVVMMGFRPSFFLFLATFAPLPFVGPPLADESCCVCNGDVASSSCGCCAPFIVLTRALISRGQWADRRYFRSQWRAVKIRVQRSALLACATPSAF